MESDDELPTWGRFNVLFDRDELVRCAQLLKPWFFCKINLKSVNSIARTLSQKVNMPVNETNVTEMYYWCSVKHADTLTWHTGFEFKAKPLESFLDKLIFRQLDVHDMVRSRIPLSSYNRIKSLMSQTHSLFEEKTTKNGVICSTWCVRLINNVTSNNDYGLSMWVEVQTASQDSSDSLDHALYELERLEVGDRFMDIIKAHSSYKSFEFVEARSESLSTLLSSLS